MLRRAPRLLREEERRRRRELRRLEEERRRPECNMERTRGIRYEHTMCRRIIYFILQLLTATTGWSMVWTSLTLTTLGNQILRVEGTVFLFIIEANRCNYVFEFLNGFCNGSGWFLFCGNDGRWILYDVSEDVEHCGAASQYTFRSRTIEHIMI